MFNKSTKIPLRDPDGVKTGYNSEQVSFESGKEGKVGQGLTLKANKAGKS